MYINKAILKSSHQKGFSLIELMVAMVIFMVVMLGLIGSLMTSIKTTKGTVLRDEAVRLAQDELNRLRSERFTFTAISSELGPTTWTTTETVTTSMRGNNITYALSRQIRDIAGGTRLLKRLDVAVGWNDVGGNNTTALAPTNSNYQAILSTVLVQND